MAPRIPVPVQIVSQEECSTVETRAGPVSWAHLPCPGLPLLTTATSGGWLPSLSNTKRSPWSSGSPDDPVLPEGRRNPDPRGLTPSSV